MQPLNLDFLFFLSMSCALQAQEHILCAMRFGLFWAQIKCMGCYSKDCGLPYLRIGLTSLEMSDDQDLPSLQGGEDYKILYAGSAGDPWRLPYDRG